MGITFLTDKKKGLVFVTAKRILERFGIQTSSSFDKSVFLILKPISYFFGAWFFLSINCWSSLNHDLTNYNS